MVCDVCSAPFGEGEFERKSDFGYLTGLSSNVCGHCVEAMDFRITSTEQLAAKSLLRRANFNGTDDNSKTMLA